MDNRYCHDDAPARIRQKDRARSVWHCAPLCVRRTMDSSSPLAWGSCERPQIVDLHWGAGDGHPGGISPDMLRPIGLPGMAQVAAQAVDYAAGTGAWFPILTVTGTFSAGLSVANMLPLPALDGGRLLFIAIEAIRGRRVSPEREGMFHFVGIVVLITLMVLISINDLMAPLAGDRLGRALSARPRWREWSSARVLSFRRIFKKP